MRGLAADPASLRPGAHGGFSASIGGDMLVLDGGTADSTSHEALLTALEVAWSQPTPPSDVRAESAAAEAALAKWW